MTVAVPSEHTSTHSLPCLSVGVSAAGAWSTAAAAGVLERDEAPRNKRPHPLEAITIADESCFVAFASYIAKNAPCRCLTGCLHAALFEALRSFIQCDITIIIAASSLNGSECDNTNDGKESDEDYGDDLHRGADYLRVLVHESQEGLNAVPTIPGLAEPLAFALSPAVISAPCVEADPFTVEFTQQLSSGCAAGPALALSHVFQGCLACGLLCVVQAAASSFIFVPNKKHFALRWVFICVAVDARDDAQRVCLLFGGHEGDFGVCRQHREIPC
ncbi:hypothetical protein TCDM_12698 [Trypanosoma cruzi Dm28c]|uniref:Uncharacterized protein n=2 Tax=Trypanosoma cruzi TaxID=5693 RepID=V5AQ90_TRYCR|nr:hypothetical protein TCDM_12698 [Trypanosoma cruzi Dm28c]PWU86936.1 hypothetical protein C4B63_106g61 [Trypanosoma cruzi]